MLHHLALLLLTQLVSASPTADLSGLGGKLTLTQMVVGKKFKNGAVSKKQTFEKYNRPVPASLVAAAAAALQSGSVTATPEAYDSEYLCPVDVGTPAQTLMLDFDTGSSDLWVCCTEQPASQRAGHTCYNPTLSSTARKMSGERWQISYGDGSSASGDVYSDKVVIGGVTATSQAVECATSASSEFVSDVNNDGLVGLAFPYLNTGTPNRLATFWQNIQGSTPLNVFAAWLKKGQPGAYDFGYLNTSHYSGSVTYTSVDNSQGFWTFTITNYFVGTTQYNSQFQAIADTGTTLMYLPDALVKNYYAKVSGAQNSNSYGGWVFPCTASLPSLSFTIAGRKATVPGSYINYAPVDSSGTTCYGGLQSSAGLGLNILGDIFLKSQYVVFDFGNTRIGFATAK